MGHESREKKRTVREMKKRGSRVSDETRENMRKLNRQQKAANIRAKYGPARKPAPIVVKSLQTGEVVAVRDQDRFAKKVFAESLEQKAHDAGYLSYGDYLRSPHWRALRDRVMDRDGYRCRRCGAKGNLGVHHRFYVRLGAESLQALETLCARCHRRIHD